MSLRYAVVEWSKSRRKCAAQLERLEHLAADVIVVYGVPRHQRKKITRQAWTARYHTSKESRSVTVSRGAATSESGTSLLFSKHPSVTQEWFALNEGGYAHVVDVVVPMNVWRNLPLSLLEEYQLTYEELATVTFVIVDGDGASELIETFTANNANSVVFITPCGEAGVARLQTRHTLHQYCVVLDDDDSRGRCVQQTLCVTLEADSDSETDSK